MTVKAPERPDEEEAALRPVQEDGEDDEEAEGESRRSRAGRRTSIPLILSPHTAHSSRLFVGRQDRYYRRPMSKIRNRDKAPRDGGSAEERLARLLDTPFLAHVVPHLAPETLHQLIRFRGLEACSELVTSATPEQITSLLDLDLWRHARPGCDEPFDVDRFGEWLDVLVDAGDSVAARTVAALDKDLVIVGLSRYVRVFDAGIFEPTAQSDDEPMDRDQAMRQGDAIDVDETRDADLMHADAGLMHDVSGDRLECEVAGYIVRARRADVWDAVVTLLIALDAEHGNYFHAVMRGCRRLSNSRPEIDGLDDLLQAPEQHVHDLAIERERRRSEHGYATPADARAFLEMARAPQPARSGAVMKSVRGNPIVTAYFRAADEAAESPNETARSAERNLESPPSNSPSASMSLPSTGSYSGGVDAHAFDLPESLEAVMQLLTEAGVMPERPRALLEAADADPQAVRLTRLRPLMAYVRDRDETAHLTRTRELAFLANTLLAGCSVQSRPFTPREASDAAAGICNLGLEHWPERWPSITSPGAPSPHRHVTAAATPPDMFPPDSLLIDHDLVTAFEVGWSVLHRDVSLFAADQLISTLTDLDCIDRDIGRGLVALRRTLVQQRDAGTPWRARDAAEILAMLDMTAWISVLGLLDECPILPAALIAVVEGRTTSVSPTAFAFISTAAQIGDVRSFMRKLPELLSG
jgi:Family of unknown function (DUF6178)